MEFLKRIEEKWQKKWQEARIFEANPDPTKPKFYLTVAYPYPNSPQHIGHARTYTLTDAYARYMRMRGYTVLFPMAFHYTGTPVLAMAKRLQENDEELVKDFIEVYKIPKEKLEELTEPIAMARYFHQEIKEGMKEIGFSIDWRREFTTVDPQYSRFIEWQFQKLKKGGYISRGSHPVGWCPRDGNPVGQHDTKGDVEPEIGEFILIKFKYDDFVLPAATLRPETVFGVTNIWLNPKTKYVKATVDGEKWIISQESVEKLEYLGKKVKILEVFEGKKLIGKCAENRVTNAKIPILPADFVDPKNATGVVMSVPAHAPYDYVALENIKKLPALLKEYGLTSEDIDSLKPSAVIETPEYKGVPAAEIVKKTHIQSQLDKKLEDATKELYRHEFHGGKMMPNTGKYFGLPVTIAKDKVKQDLIAEGKAETMYELLNRPVICRCGTECIVKIFKDQWFINYGQPEWKALAHKNLDQMRILPEDLRSEYNYVIDWLHEKACARKSGMGTKLPWDHEWTIESLSDSTIYMAYYTIVKHIKEHKIKPEQLTEEVFDYIFLGIGNAADVAGKARLDAKVAEQMRNEFLYFYPLDSRHSAHELIPNHLTFMIFNHTAIFAENLWPRQIVTNGHVLMEGVKMSKSFGNIIPLREGLATFGADPIRLSVLSTAELLQDSEFSPPIAKSMSDRLERLYRFACDVSQTGQKENSAEKSLTAVDRWMLSRLQEHIEKATEAMDKLAVRKAIHAVLYALDQDFQWYLNRIKDEKENAERKDMIAYAVGEVLDAQILMLAPVAPHICEEVWELTHGAGFVANASWPIVDETKRDIEAEENEALVAAVIEDTKNIIKATGLSPNKICYYVAAPWKWKIYLRALEKTASVKVTQRDLMNDFMQDPEFKARADSVARFVSQIVDEVNQMREERREQLIRVGLIDENHVLKSARAFLERELKTEVHVYDEEDCKSYDPKRKASLAKPHRPAIYLE